jgi:hypothetical protein
MKLITPAVYVTTEAVGERVVYRVLQLSPSECAGPVPPELCWLAILVALGQDVCHRGANGVWGGSRVCGVYNTRGTQLTLVSFGYPHHVWVVHNVVQLCVTCLTQSTIRPSCSYHVSDIQMRQYLFV